MPPTRWVVNGTPASRAAASRPSHSACVFASSAVWNPGRPVIAPSHSVSRALNLSAQAVRLKFLRVRLLAVARSVKAGSTLSAALREHNALNPTGYDLVAVGEASGELPKLLAALARLYETTGRDRMKRALQLIEPLAIIVIGIVVGTIMTAIILAITSVNDVPL